MEQSNQPTKTGDLRTEIGVIPNDWQVKKFGQVMHIKHGKDQKAVQVEDGLYPIFGTGGQMGTTNTALYEKPSVLIGRKGTINKPRFIDIPFWTVDTLFYSEIFEKQSAKFIYYKFCLIDWMQHNEASGVPSLNASKIKNISASFPEFEEQTAIANALSDVDALLTEMETLIAKKQAIKTATMQQLLTGKTRLPQFAMREDGSLKRTKQSDLGEIPEDWEVYNLPDVVWYQEGPGLRKWQFKAKGLKVINVTNLQQNGFLDLDRTDRHISWDEYEKTYKHFACDEGDLVIASSGNSYCKSSTIRKCDLPLLMNTSVIRFKPVGDFSKGFMDVYLKSPYFKDQIDLLITGGAQPNFGPAHLNKIKIPAPANPEEQTAIATILSDMDNEIQTLEQRLAKTRQIKQGMMQELLTGRTRLPYDKE